MKSSVETLDPTRVKLVVEVPYAEFEPSVQQAYRDIAQQVTIPGFRKGKVPARIIDQRFGRGMVIEEAVNGALPRLYSQAVDQADIRPLGQPKLDVDQVPMGGTEDLKFSVEVDVRPTIDLTKAESLAVTVEALEVTDADIQQELDDIRVRFSTLIPVDHPAEKDDFVTLDLVASKDDEEIDTATNVSYQVGLGTLMPGLDEAITGLSAGEQTSFEAPLAGEHLGEQGLITVTVQAVKERKLPEVDEEFIDMATEFDTLEELQASLRAAAEQRKKVDQGVQARDRVLATALESTDFPLPQGVVDHEVEHALQNDPVAAGTSADDHKAKVETAVRTTLREQLYLDALAEANDIQITQEELTQHLVMMAYRYGMEPQQFIEMLSENGQISSVAADVSRGKALLSLVQKATVTDSKGNPVDLSFLWSDPASDADNADVGAANTTAETVSANPAAVSVSDLGEFVPESETEAK